MTKSPKFKILRFSQNFLLFFMLKILKFILLFLFNFYKTLWFWFLSLPKAGKILVCSFLVFAFAISSLANNSNQNIKKAEVLGINSSQSESSQFSRTDSLSSLESSQNSSSILNSVSETVLNSNNNSQNSMENSKETSQEAVVPVPVPVLAVLNSENNSQNLPKSQEKTEPIVDVNKTTKSPKIDKKLYQVLEIVDGDTIKISEIGTLRLIGIDTPETKDPRKVVQCFGVEASNNAKNLLSGQKVYLEFDKSKPILDKYQRTLAYVFREDGYFYNLETVKDGFAHSYKSFPHPKLDEFNLAENNARSGKIGFWAESSCNGNTEQGVSGEVAKANVPPTGGTQKETQTPKAEIQVEKPAVGNFDSNNDGKVTCKDFKGQVTDPNILAQYPKLDGNSDGIGCESN